MKAYLSKLSLLDKLQMLKIFPLAMYFFGFNIPIYKYKYPWDRDMGNRH